MAKITYNNNEIAPVESVSISHDPVHNDNGDRISNSYTININGKLLVTRGSPTSSGTFRSTGTECEVIAETGIGDNNWLESLLAKRCALANLFETDYQKLSIGTVSATNDLTCYPRLLGLTVDQSDNPQYWPFSISLLADNLFCNGVAMDPTGNYKLRSTSESWEFTFDEGTTFSEVGDNRVYSVTHNVSAQGVRSYNASGTIAYSGIDAARSYVLSKIGSLAQQPVVGASGFDNYTTKYNYVDVHSIDVGTSNYSVNESWIYSTGAYTEEYTIESQTSNSKTCPIISINGTITGLGVRSLASGDITVSKYANAKTFWDSLGTSGLRSRCQSRTGATLYSSPTSTSVSLAPIAGTIAYNYEFGSGPTRALPEAVWENISVSNTFGEEMFTVIPILGKGELIQTISGSGYHRASKLTLTIDAVYPCNSGINKFGPRYSAATSGSLAALVNSYNPVLAITGVGYCVVESQSESWSPYDGSYNRNITYSYQMSGVCS
jgi:hypothetical protein